MCEKLHAFRSPLLELATSGAGDLMQNMVKEICFCGPGKLFLVSLVWKIFILHIFVLNFHLVFNFRLLFSSLIIPQYILEVIGPMYAMCLFLWHFLFVCLFFIFFAFNNFTLICLDGAFFVSYFSFSQHFDLLVLLFMF